ncbi:hypothetical protein CQB05_04725 [Paracidovorax citrulli]|nr:hypothetical protein CQB05_04725 [Paracidovorax citrulli]
MDAALQPKIGTAVKRVLKAGGSDFRFPALSGTEAAALMQAAGIVNENGKLAKQYPWRKQGCIRRRQGSPDCRAGSGLHQRGVAGARRQASR